MNNDELYEKLQNNIKNSISELRNDLGVRIDRLDGRIDDVERQYRSLRREFDKSNLPGEPYVQAQAYVIDQRSINPGPPVPIDWALE